MAVYEKGIRFLMKELQKQEMQQGSAFLECLKSNLDSHMIQVLELTENQMKNVEFQKDLNFLRRLIQSQLRGQIKILENLFRMTNYKKRMELQQRKFEFNKNKDFLDIEYIPRQLQKYSKFMKRFGNIQFKNKET